LADSARIAALTHRVFTYCSPTTLKLFGISDASTRPSCEGILDVKGFELPKIAIVRVERANAVLEEDRRDVPVGHEVSANRDVPDDMRISVEEVLQFGHGPRVWP
jgi:hypothetical protein